MRIDPNRQLDAELALPPGTPQWVSAELIEATLRCWQRYYDRPLTVDDVVTMILNAGRMFDALAGR